MRESALACVGAVILLSLFLSRTQSEDDTERGDWKNDVEN